MQTATKRPATTMNSAIVDALRSVGGKRLAVASGYTEEVNVQFRVFLEESGFEVPALRCLGLVRPPDNLSRSDSKRSSSTFFGLHRMQMPWSSPLRARERWN